MRCEGRLIKALVAALLKNQGPFLGVSSMACCASEALVYLIMDFSLLSLQGLLHSCLVPCYVCKQVTSSVFPKFVFLWVSSSQSAALGSASLDLGKVRNTNFWVNPELTESETGGQTQQSVL